MSQPDRWVSAKAVADVLEDAAASSESDDVGLRLAENRHLANLGPLSLVIRDEPLLRDAMQTLIRYNHIYNEALQIRVVEADEVTTIRLDLNIGTARPPRQSIELVAGSLVGIRPISREITGARWPPGSAIPDHRTRGGIAECSATM